MHLLRYAVKFTVTNSPFNTQANCSRCPPSARMHFFTRVTREFVTLRSTAALLTLLAALRIRCSKFFSRVHLVCMDNSFHVTPHMVI